MGSLPDTEEGVGEESSGMVQCESDQRADSSCLHTNFFGRFKLSDAKCYNPNEEFRLRCEPTLCALSSFSSFLLLCLISVFHFMLPTRHGPTFGNTDGSFALWEKSVSTPKSRRSPALIKQKCIKLTLGRSLGKLVGRETHVYSKCQNLTAMSQVVDSQRPPTSATQVFLGFLQHLRDLRDCKRGMGVLTVNPRLH